MDSSTKLSSIEKEIHRARMDIDRYKEFRQAVESVKAQAEFELYNAKNTVKNLFSMIEESSYKAKSQKPLSWNDDDKKYSKVMRELEHAKRELFQLKLDVASVSEEKLRAEKVIEVSKLNMMSCSRVAEELWREIEVVGEEQLLVELARIDALKDIEASREKKANELSFELESTRNKLKEAVKEIDESKELEAKLAMTISDIDVLQNELKLVKGKELQIVKEEIEGKKKELALIREEGFQFMTCMDVIRNEMKNVTADTVDFKSKVDSKVHNLKFKLLRAKSKLEDVSSAEEKAKSIVINLSHSLENLKTQTVAAKTEKELIHQEVNATKEEIKKTELEKYMTEERLRGAVQELEGIKSSEVFALEKLRTINENSMRDRGLATKASSLITISKFEYEYLTNHATKAKEIADKKVAAAKASIEALKASEKEILMKTKLAETKLEAYVKEKLVPKRDTNEELENWSRKRDKNPSRDLHRAMSRKSNKLDGSVTPSKRSKFQNSASPHVSPFTIKKKKMVMPNFTKFFRGKRSTTSTL